MFAILALTPVSRVLAAQPTDCPTEPFITTDSASLVLQPKVSRQLSVATLSGRAHAPSTALAALKPSALCLSSVGDGLQVDGSDLCVSMLRDSDSFGSKDAVTFANGVASFKISRPLYQSSERTIISLARGRRVCAGALGVEVRPGPQGRFTEISGLPNDLAPDHARIALGPGPQARDLSWSVAVIQPATTAADEAPDDDRPQHGPRSWSAPIAGSPLTVRALLRPIVLAISLLAIVVLFERRTLAVGDRVELWEDLRGPLKIAFGLVAAGTITQTAQALAPVLLHWLLSSVRDAPDVIALLTAGPEPRVLATEPLQPVIVASLLVGAVTLRLLLGLSIFRADAAAGALVLFVPDVAVWGAALALVGALITSGAWIVEAHVVLGFEGPALMISLLFSTAAVVGSRRLLGLGAKDALIIALIAALTVLFPTDPALTSTGTVTIAANTSEWTRFIADPAGRFLYAILLAAAALRLSGGASARSVAAWTSLILAFEVASFGLSSLTNVAAFAAVAAVLPAWLFSARADDRAATEIDDTQARRFAVRVAGGAVLIFLFQFIFRQGGGAGDRFTALALGTVITVAATGLVAGLLMARALPYRLGDSPTVKALAICLIIEAANVAASLDDIRGRTLFLGALSEEMNVMASLLFCTLVTFELPKIREQDGQMKWKDLFKGTSLANAVPIVSGIAIATFSALSPVLTTEVGKAFGEMLQASIPHQASAPPPK